MEKMGWVKTVIQYKDDNIRYLEPFTSYFL